MKKIRQKQKKATLRRIVAEIRKAKTCFVAGHENPEGDALGSTLALGLGLKKLKKKVKFYNVDPAPRSLHFLPGADKLSSVLSSKEYYDVAFMLDVGERSRLGKAFMNHTGFGKVICLDHHAVGSHEGDLNLILPKAPAAGVVVYHVLRALGFKKFNKAIATNLYTAIVTDTGSFKYSNTTAETLGICSELLMSGIDPWDVARHCFEIHPRSRVELLKRALRSLKIHRGGKIAWIKITLTDLKKCGAKVEDADSLINYARSVEGVEIGLCFRQLEKNKFKVSFRSNEYANVGALAAQFGGGGHVRSAGCVVAGTLKEVKKRILKAALKEV